jgi:hypothetical protein
VNASTRSYTRISALVFTIVAVLQAWRAASGFPVVIDGWTLPIAASWAACIVAAALAIWGWRAR